MRAWPSKLAALLKDVPPIGLHFFIWRELTYPEYYRLYYEDYPTKWVVEEPSWDKLQSANEGRAEQAIGGAEKWDKRPGVMGRFRLFGKVSREELDRIVGVIAEVLKNADETIGKYQQLPVEPWRNWKVRREARDRYEHGLTEYRLLGLIGLSQGYEYDDIEILVQAEDSDRFIPCEQEFIHEPWDGVRIGSDIYVLRDFVRSFAWAVKRWVPDGIEDTTMPVDQVHSAKPSWDGSTLMFLGKVIKQYTKPALNQRIVLETFNDDGWPKQIDDPLPPVKDQETQTERVEQEEQSEWVKQEKQRKQVEKQRKRVRDTVAALNDDHKAPGLIRFEADG